MHRFVANAASKARLANNGDSQIGIRLSWSRNYAAKDIKLGAKARRTANNVAAGDGGANCATVRIRATFVEGSEPVAFAMNAIDLKGPVGGPIGLPDTRALYTVLRSPHIDKKSREQFEMRIKKRLLVIETKTQELRHKYFWLKRLRVFGAQYEVSVSCKTRLDKKEILERIAQIGGASKAEGGEKKDKVTLNATKAVKEGIVPGGGVALL